MQDPVGARRSYLSKAAALMETGASTSRCRPYPLVFSWDGLGAGRVISTKVREAGNPTDTFSGTRIMGWTATVRPYRSGAKTLMSLLLTEQREGYIEAVPEM